MRSWSSLLARASMSGRTEEDDELIAEFFEDVVTPGHQVVSYDPRLESVLVLSAEAANHLLELSTAHQCDICRRINSQLEVQENRREPST